MRPLVRLTSFAVLLASLSFACSDDTSGSEDAAAADAVSDATDIQRELDVHPDTPGDAAADAEDQSLDLPEPDAAGDTGDDAVADIAADAVEDAEDVTDDAAEDATDDAEEDVTDDAEEDATDDAEDTETSDLADADASDAADLADTSDAADTAGDPDATDAANEPDTSTGNACKDAGGICLGTLADCTTGEGTHAAAGDVTCDFDDGQGVCCVPPPPKHSGELCSDQGGLCAPIAGCNFVDGSFAAPADDCPSVPVIICCLPESICGEENEVCCGETVAYRPTCDRGTFTCDLFPDTTLTPTRECTF